MQLIAIGGKNFLGYSEANLALSGLDSLVLVTGKNYDFAAISENGAGKSTIAELIAYSFFGRTLRNLEARYGKDAVVRHGSHGGMMVWIEVELPSGLLRIERYRNHPEYQNKIRAWLNGQDVVRGRTAADTDSRIEQLLGFDYDLFKRAVVIHSRLTESFSTLENRLIKQIAERLLGLRDFDGLRKYTSEQLAKSEAERAKVEHDCETIETQLEQLEEQLGDLAAKQRNHELQQKDAKAKLDADLKAVETDVKRLDKELLTQKTYTLEGKKRTERLEEKHQNLRTQRATLAAAVAKDTEQIAELNAERNAISRQVSKYDKLSGKQCPECDQPVSPDHIERRKVELTKQLDALGCSWLTTQTVLAAATDKLAKLDQEIDQAAAKASEAKEAAADAKRQHAIVTAQLAAAHDRLAQLSEQRAALAVNPYTELIANTRGLIATQEGKQAKAKTELKAQDERLRYLKFWVWGFGPSGVRSFMLDGATPHLNRLANFYLDKLTDSTMGLTLNTIKANKDGSYRDQFDIDVTNESGAAVLGGDSDGELACVDLALNLAMSDMLESRVTGGIGLLFLDQVLDLLDNARAALAVRLLRQKTDSTWCSGYFPPKERVFVISHKTEIQDMIGGRLLVEKREGVCSLVGC